MRPSFWWVNHSHSAEHEIDGSYLWFARKNLKSKARGESDRNLQRVVPGDIVFSFVNSEIGAVGVVMGAVRDAAKPGELAGVAQYADAKEGWLVPVRFMNVPQPLRTEAHCTELSLVLPRKHSPILISGVANQHLPLAHVPPAMVSTLQRLLGGELERIVGAITDAAGRSLTEDAAEAAIQQRVDIGQAQKTELLRARLGQGRFRESIEGNEQSCRITGVVDRRHLRAVHIKPWCEGDDTEKLDGYNGLLMSPHIAHLFERGYISFADDGDLILSPELNAVVLDRWHIAPSLNVGTFKPEQCYFLDYHRREVFQQHGGGGRRQKAFESDEEIPAALDAEPVVVNPA
jgi:putative restriction endonuclease